MLKLAFAITLALSLNFIAIAAPGAIKGADEAHPASSPDGINRRAARRSRRRAGRTRQRRRAQDSQSTAAGGGRVAASKTLPQVREIDAEGLQNLLQRGEGETARPLLVNFWATWCGPCRAEFPDLVRVAEAYRGRGLEFVLISADDVAEIKTGVPKFLRQMRAAAIPAYLLNATDPQGAIAQVDPTWGGELPATFLFDRHGKLIFKHTGRIDPAELREAVEKVRGDR